MMKEYIYNRYNGIITTYKKLNDNVYICLETGLTIDLDIELMLGKNSESIIDLIEVGDYVNGYKVINVINGECCPSGKCVDIDSSMQSNECTFWESDIKSIVTKEQFKSVEYKVGG